MSQSYFVSDKISNLILHPAKSPMSPCIFLQRGEKLRLTEIRPERRRDDEFGVGNLPEQKIAYAHFAARANQQIGIGNSARPEIFRNDFLVDVRCFKFSLFYFFRNRSHSLDDLNPAAVAQRHDERQSVVF